MGTSARELDTTAILLGLLKGAAQAHGQHEKELGKPDPDWPQWYAEHMTRALRQGGYRIAPAAER